MLKHYFNILTVRVPVLNHDVAGLGSGENTTTQQQWVTHASWGQLDHPPNSFFKHRLAW